MIDVTNIKPRICHNCNKASGLTKKVYANDNWRYVDIPEWLYCSKFHQPKKFCEALCCSAYEEDK